MEYKAISPKTAMSVKSYLAPGVSDDPSFDKYFYYAATGEDGGMRGLLAIDPAESGAEILSIGMSPEYCGQGYGSDLLGYAIRDISVKLEKAHVHGLTLSADICIVPDTNDRLARFFEKNGFILTEECPVFNMTLSELEDVHLLREAEKKSGHEGLVSLKNVSDKILHSFSNEVINKGLYPGITRNGLDEDVSTFCVSGHEVRSCALFEKLSDGVLQNTWMYVSHDVADKLLFPVTLAHSLKEAMKKYPGDTAVSFLVMNDRSRKIMDKIDPNGRPSSVFCTYERTVIAHDDTFDRERELDNPVFEAVSIDGMCCKGCAHNTGDVLGCAKFIQKPDSVLDGGNCRLYEGK